METKVLQDVEFGERAHSNPTYEVWKQFDTVPVNWDGWALQSYLWGMETTRQMDISTSPFPTPILPMRYGNMIVAFVDGEFSPKLQSYLWGMETYKINPNFLIQLSSLQSYLWGMETT